MHPLLASRLRVLLYLGLWMGVGALLAAVFVLADPRPWAHAAAFTGPLVVVYAFACLSALWVCRSQPMGSGRPWVKAAVLAREEINA